MEQENNYKAVVVRLGAVRKHSNADRLQCTNIFGNNIIVGLEAKEGDLGLYFPLESEIGLEFAVANDLIRRKDEEGKPAGGMFDANRRVRAQTLRGEKSAGFWCPYIYLTKMESDLGLELTAWGEGDELSEYKGYSISKKYVPFIQGARNSGTGKPSTVAKVKRVIENMFNFHFNTAQLGKNTHKISPTDLISVSWKMHGTSAIVARCLVRTPINWKQKLVLGLGKLLGIRVSEPVEYDYIFSSRQVIKNNVLGQTSTGYYSTDIHSEAGRSFVGTLHKGETIYYEIVGFDGNGRAIQKQFDYGCELGKHEIYIYRITQTNADGVVTELAWPQVMERARELGKLTVPHIYYGEAGAMFPDLKVEEHWNVEFLKRLQETFVKDQDSVYCKNKVPEEGIVVRKEGLAIENFKLKAHRFLEFESKQLDKGEVDMETLEAQEEYLNDPGNLEN